MRSIWGPTLVPGGVALVGAAALAVWWFVAGAPQTLEARVPGMDRPAGLAAAVEKPLVGALATLDGKPSDLPGLWPGFRGPDGSGMVTDSAPLARTWPEGGPPVLWSIDLGEGYAGAAVRLGCVYVLDYDRQASADALRCFSLADGKEIWRYSYPVDIKRNHGMSRTVPAVSDEFVVALGPKCHVSCLDPRTGKAYWLIDLAKKFGATVPPWYAGQCPLLEGDRVILAPGGPDALLVALEAKTGRVVWKTPNPRGWVMTHSSIVPMEFAGRRMFVYCGKGGVAGVAADTGELLWDTADWKISIATCPSPVPLPEGRIFCCGGYNAGSVMLQLTEQSGRIAPKTAFRLKASTFGSTQQTPLYYEGHLFGVRERDKEMVCLDLEGKVVWESGSGHRFGLGPYLIGNGLLFVLDDSGKLTMAEASTSAFAPLGTAQVLDGHDAWAPMALVNGRLLLRDFTRMACVDLTGK